MMSLLLICLFLILGQIQDTQGVDYLALPDLIEELQTGLAPCVGPCLLQQAWTLHQEVGSGTGDYSTCVDPLSELLTEPLTSPTEFFDLLNYIDDTQNCGALNTTLDCLVNLFTERCGAGLEEPFKSLAAKAAVFVGCGAQQTITCSLSGLTDDTLIEGPDPPYTRGTNLKITCSPGYRFGQGSHLQEQSVYLGCTRAGWNVTQVPNCLPVHCGAAPVIENGYVDSSANNGFTYGQSVTYKCNDGFWFNDQSPTIDCLITGQWETAPQCIARSCLDLADEPPDQLAAVRTRVSGSGNDHGTIESFQCDTPGTTIQGNPFRICRSGSWEPSDISPPCEQIRCTIPSNFDLLNAEQPDTDDLDADSSLTVDCKPGYTLMGLAEVTCDQSGTLSDLPTCQDIDECDNPDTNSCQSSCTNTVGSYVCSCPEGERLSEDLTTCTVIGTCDDMPDLCPDGTCIPNGDGQSAVPAAYVCQCDGQVGRVLFEADGDQGYQSPDSEANLDTVNNTLRVDHTCVLRQCPFDNTLTNGHLLSYQPVYHVGDSVTLGCEPGYVLQGDQTLTCDVTGQWSAEVPTCVPATCAIPNAEAVTYSPSYSMSAPNVDNGIPLSSGDSVSYGATVILTCTQFRAEPLILERKCEFNMGTQSYTLGQDEPYNCPVVMCVPPYDSLDVGTGTVVLTEGTANLYESTYTVECTQGDPTGDPNFQCGEDGKWTIGSTTCQDPVLQCPDPGTPYGATQVISNLYLVGSDVTYTCDQAGYIFSPADFFLTCDDDPLQFRPPAINFALNNQEILNREIAFNVGCLANVPPVITNCPSNQTVDLYDSVDLLTPTVTDMYGGTSILETTTTPEFVSTANIATTTVVTHIATTRNDPIDPTVSVQCSYTITVRNYIPPEASCPDPFVHYTTVSGSQDTISVPLPQGASSVSPATIQASQARVGDVTIITATFEDNDNNMAQCKFMALVKAGCAEWSLRTPANGVKDCTPDGDKLFCTLTCNDGYYFPGGSTTTQTFNCDTANHAAGWDPPERVSDCLDPPMTRYRLSITFFYSLIGDFETCMGDYQTQLQTIYNAFFGNNPTCPQNADITLSPSSANLPQISIGSTPFAEATFTLVLSRNAYLPEVDTDPFQACEGALKDEALLSDGSIFDGFLVLGTSQSACSANREFSNQPPAPPGAPATFSGLQISCFQDELFDNNGDCIRCPRGTYRIGVQICRDCPVGTYSSTIAATECENCPSGYTTATPGSIGPDDCIETCSFFHNQANSQFSGTSSTGYVPCVECPDDGVPSQTNSSTTCDACPGSNPDCPVPCERGTYSPTGYPDCTPCPAGFYTDQTGQQICKECQSSQTTTGTGSITIEQCVDVSGVTDQCNGLCINGGMCAIVGHVIGCLCPEGLTGNTCESNIACNSNPCRNGGTCVPSTDSFTCSCVLGYSNTFCEDHDFCLNVDCNQNGECHDTGTAGECICKPGYSGPSCEPDNGYPCDTSPCQNDGECVDMGDVRRVCNCLSGFTGESCQTDIDECASTPCLNGGQCMDTTNGYTCSCGTLYGGDDCGQRLACTSSNNDCVGERCILDATPEGKKCVCPPGFTATDTVSRAGTWWESFPAVSVQCMHISPCDDDPCLNGGSCSDTDPPSDQYICDCPSGYTGLRCQIDIAAIDTCTYCLNGGTCTLSAGNEGFTCDCPAGYTNTQCQEEIDPCASSTCDDGAVCQRSGASFTCQFPDACLSDPCRHGGSCVSEADDGTYTCTCVPGWTGLRCGSLIPVCTDQTPCVDNSQCYSLLNDYYCNCSENTAGPDCSQSTDTCSVANPCSGSATCLNRPQSDVECDCDETQLTGDYCETEADLCLEDGSPLCQYGQQCVSGPNAPICRGEEPHCLANPRTYVGFDTLSEDTSKVSLFACYEDYRLSVGGLAAQTFQDEASFNAYLMDLAADSCQALDVMIQCMVDAVENLANCQQLMVSEALYGPTLYYFKRLGGCGNAALLEGKDYVEDCRCVDDYKVDKDIFGLCTTNRTVMDTIINVMIGIDWTDDSIQKGCGDVSAFEIVCNAVDEVAREAQITRLAFRGAFPTPTQYVAMTFSVTSRTGSTAALTSGIRDLVERESILDIPVFPNVDVIEQTPGDILIMRVHPNFGPQSGGTKITITGFNLDTALTTTVGGIDCPFTSSGRSRVVIICSTKTLEEVDEPLLEQALNVSLQFTNDTFYTGSKFRYRPDPVILKIYPLVTILSGGIQLTVEGENFDSVSRPIMVTRLTARATGKFTIYETVCTVVDPFMMLCPAPTLILSDVLGRRRRDVTSHDVIKSRKRRQAGTTVNAREDVDVEISFELDGVKEYLNLTGGTLEEYSKLTVYYDPKVFDFDSPDNTLIFTSTWPVEDKLLEIKAEGVDTALQPKDIKIKVGLVDCSNLELYENRMVCEPPLKRPETGADDDDPNDTKIPVKVFIVNMVYRVGLMEYRQTIWEHPPGRFGIIGGICALLVIVIVVVLFFLYRRYRQRPYDRGYRTPSNNRQSASGSYYSQERRFQSYVPRAVRRPASNYSGSGGYSRNFDNSETMGRRTFRI